MREIIIADNQYITRAGLYHLVEEAPSHGTIGTASSKAELVALLQQSPSALVITDYTLMDFASEQDLLIISQRFPKVSWLLFSQELSTAFLRRILFSSSAFSVVLKEDAEEEIRSALSVAMRGERFICNSVSNLLLAPDPHPASALPPARLTPSEQSILRAIALGKTTKEIAAEKNLSFHTVNTHRKNIFRKLNVNNLQEAARYAVKAGIVELAEYYI